jgi:hypothetical protein
MNKIVKFVTTTAIILFLGTFSVAATNPAKDSSTEPPRWVILGDCSQGWLLYGSYGFRVTAGQFITGTLNFNGECGLAGVNTYVGQDGGVVDLGLTGTYSVNADGTVVISMTIGQETTPQMYVVALSKVGPGAVGIGINGTPGQIELVSQNNYWFSRYDNASLRGSFAVLCKVNGGLNYVTFDGKGGLTGVDPVYSNGVEASNPYTGSYSVNTDGTFSGSLNGSFSEYTFYGAIENSGNQIVYMYDNASFGVDDSCVGSH